MTFTNEAVDVTDVTPQSDVIVVTGFTTQVLLSTLFTAETFEVS